MPVYIDHGAHAEMRPTSSVTTGRVGSGQFVIGLGRGALNNRSGRFSLPLSNYIGYFYAGYPTLRMLR